MVLMHGLLNHHSTVAIAPLLSISGESEDFWIAGVEINRSQDCSTARQIQTGCWGEASRNKDFAEWWKLCPWKVRATHAFESRNDADTLEIFFEDGILFNFDVIFSGQLLGVGTAFDIGKSLGTYLEK